MATPLITADPSTDARVETDELPEEDDAQHAHIVKVGPGEKAAAVVLEARVMGTPVEALCGYVWVPNKDPQQLPICPKCKDIYEVYRVFSGLGDTPAS